MTAGNVLAIDQGTSSTKALVVAPDGSVLSIAEAPVRPTTVGEGGVEQDPIELYDSVVSAGRQALREADTTVVAVGLANQGETIVAWDRDSGEPLAPAIVWQDRRSAEICTRLAADSDRLTALTGLPLDPYFVGPKVLWLRENVTTGGVVTTTDSWLLHRMTGGYVTDVSTASRTALMDLDERRWSAEACELFGVDPQSLPEIVSCTTNVGTTEIFGVELPVTGLAVDQQAALFGEGCLAVGEAKCTYGTGAFLLANAGSDPRRSTNGLSASVAWDDNGAVSYCLDGQLYTVGAMIGWLTQLGLVAEAADLDRLGGSVPDTGGVTCIPALAGLGAPYWLPNARGSLEGLSLSSTAAHLVRAALEGIAGQVALLARATAQDLGAALETLRVDGGLTQSRLLMQLQADLLQAPVEVFASPHATALGVAQFARGGLEGARDGDPPLATPAVGARYEPQISAAAAEARLERMTAAIDRVIDTERTTRSADRTSS
jgi:glycerol kinase